jgi:TNF receptor-associated protein 1
VTNSLYTDKEVFLRELISNASDSLEKLRHLQVTGSTIADPDIPLEISIIIDKEAKTLTIKDSGVGLSKQEMVSLLGTIARSGSKAFVENAKDTKASDSIIGQFGVGFYSAFMVGSRVDVTSKPANVEESSHVWSSAGTGSYTIAPAAESESLQRGCSVTIHVKPDEVWCYL